jgi:hypothetical protein
VAYRLRRPTTDKLELKLQVPCQWHDDRDWNKRTPIHRSIALIGEKVNNPVRGERKSRDESLIVGVCSQSGKGCFGVAEASRFHLHPIHEREIQAAELAVAVIPAGEVENTAGLEGA